jgi:hypothetical protein
MTVIEKVIDTIIISRKPIAMNLTCRGEWWKKQTEKADPSIDNSYLLGTN